MVDFPSAVAIPQYRPLDYSWLGNLPNAYRQGEQQQQQIDQNKIKLQQQQQQLALSQSFSGGLPRNPDGSVNYAAVADKLARGGDINAITQLAPYQPPPASPLSSGVALPSSLQPPYTSSGNLPPAPVAAGRSTAPPNSSASSPAPSGAPTQGGTVAGLVSSALPGSDKVAAVAANIAKALKVSPDATLTPDQQTRVASLVQGYAQRSGVQPAAPAGGDQGLQRLQSAIIGQESNYGRDNRTSVTGATGPMQIQPQTFAAYAQPGENIRDPIANQIVGDRILADYYKRYNGDAARAAVAYFSGPGNVAPPGSPTPWKRDVADPTGKTVSSYVDDVQRRMGAGALRQATAPAPAGVVADAFQDLPTVNGQPIAAPPQPQQTALAAPAPQAPVGAPPAAPVAQSQPAPGSPPAAPAAAPAPAQGQAPRPIGSQVPLPRGFTDPGRAILALRQEAARYASMPNGRGTAAFMDQWANAIEKSAAPMEVKPGETLLNPRTGEVIYQAPQRSLFGRGGTPEMAADIAQGIKDGTQPPSLTGLYGMAGPIRAELSKDRFDLAKAQIEWSRAQRQIAALNGPQMTRFVGLASSVNGTIDEVKELAQQMELSGIPVLNAAEIASYIHTAGNTPGGQLATQYVTAINTLKEEFASLAQGGYAPTEPVWALANKQINANYGVKQLDASLSEIKRLLNYRIQGVPGLPTLGAGAANRYTGQTQTAPLGAERAAPGGGNAQSAAPQSSTGAPPIGHVEQGYEFMGGDHRDPKNWRPVKPGDAS